MKSNANTNEASQKKQKILGDKGLIVLIAFLSAFIPLSTDLYLPALPRMAENFNAAPGLINLTVILFFIFYAIGTLFWGPLSDKYGRRPVLLTGLTLYTSASILCALSGNVYQLILCRVFQAIGSGAATAVGTAIVKDVYTGHKRESILAVVQSMVMIAPITAPVLGALILSFTSWRGVFWTLSAIGLLAAAGGAALGETIDRRHSGSIFHSIGRLGFVLKNRGFTLLLITFSLVAVPMMAFITASSYIYVDGFGLSEQVYSYYFAANAMFSVLGPLLYIKISKHIKGNSIMITSLIMISAAGLLICTLGSTKPWLFAISLLPATLSISVIRPRNTNMLLEQQQGDTGAASSLINFTFTAFGSVGMTVISFNWTDKILVIGLLYLSSALLSLALWLGVSRKPYIKHVSPLHSSNMIPYVQPSAE